MSRHEGVSCDNCLRSNFQEKRFKCLICYDYDLCEICYDNNVSTSRHSPSHPMQCILTKQDFDLFYGGEGITMENPPSLTCPLCGKRGLTEVNLQEHVNSQHLETNIEVVCPICAAIPSGDPNHVTDDFATHLAIEHNTSHRAGIEDPIGGRQSMRRMFYPGRSVRGARAQRSANMHFTSGPSSVPGFSSVTANTAASSLPHVRDPYSDPIAELLSQLSGVRRNAQQLQQTVSTASQLQELQAQLQLERQRASIIRQQLDGQMSRKRSFSKALGGRISGPLSIPAGSGQVNSRRASNRTQRTVVNRQNASIRVASEQTEWSAIPLPPPVPPPLPPLFNIQLQTSPVLFGPLPLPEPNPDTLERIPGKIQTTQNGKQSGNQGASIQNKSYATAVKTADKESSLTISEDEDPRLLLSQVYDKDSEAGTESQNIDIFEQSLFVRELILSLPVESETPASSDISPVSQTAPVTARAIPVDCGILSSAGSNEQSTADDKPQNIFLDTKLKGPELEASNETGDEVEAAVGLDTDAGAANVVFSKESSSEHAARGTDLSLGVRKSNSEEKSSTHHQQLESMADLKKESSNVRQSQYSPGASNVAGIVRSQSSHPVSAFPVLVSGATEQ